MNRGNREFPSSSQLTGTHDVSSHGSSIIRVVKSSRLNNQNLKNNTRSTNGDKANKVIHIKIRSPRKLPSVDAMNDLLTFSLSRTAHHPKTRQNQSFTVQKSNKSQTVNNTETIRYNQPGSEIYQNSWKTDDFHLNAKSSIVSPSNIDGKISNNSGKNLSKVFSTKAQTFRSTRVHQNQNDNKSSAFEFENLDNILSIQGTTRSKKRNSRDKSYGILNEIKTIGTKKKIVLLALLITAVIAGIITGIVMTRKNTTTGTTITATTRPVICPSAVWHSNGTTVAGSSNGSAGSIASLLKGVYDIRVDSALNVYVADYWNYRFMKWIPSSTYGTVIGPNLGFGSSADTQHLDSATTLCFDSTESNLYLSDSANCRILKLNIASGNITVVIGSGCGNALNQIHWCDGLYVDRFDNIYVADWINDRVLKFPPSSNLSTNGVIIAGTGVSGSALNQLDTPWNIYVDESDNDTLYVTDSANHRVMKWLSNATNGTVVAGGNGSGSLYTQLANPHGVFVDSFGTVYVADYGNHRIMKWLKGANNGTLVAGISGNAGNTTMQFNGPSGIQFDKNGDMYVSEYENNRVQRFMINNTSC